MIKHRISADWSTTKPIAAFSCTPRVQDVHTKAEVVHLTSALLGLGSHFGSGAQVVVTMLQCYMYVGCRKSLRV